MHSDFSARKAAELGRSLYGKEPSVSRLGGCVNHVYRLDFGHYSRILKAAGEHSGGIGKEAFVYAVLEEKGIPASRVEHLDSSSPPKWIVMTDLGERTVPWKGGDYLSAGRLLARIHYIRFEQHGRLSEAGLEPVPYKRLCTEWFEQPLQRLAENGVISAREADSARRAAEKLMPESEAVLCHMDYSPDNIAVDCEGRIKGVLDWELAKASSRTCDLAKTELYGEMLLGDNGMLEGYRQERELPDNYEEAKLPCQLIEVVGLMDFFSTGRPDKGAVQAWKGKFGELVGRLS